MTLPLIPGHIGAEVAAGGHSKARCICYKTPVITSRTPGQSHAPLWLPGEGDEARHGVDTGSV